MDRARLRRRIRRGCFAGAAACAVLAVVPGPARAQDVTGAEESGPRPDVFTGLASAMGVSAQLEREGLLPIPNTFHFIAADGTGTYRTSEQRGRASLLYPGAGLILGPSLACSQFPPEARPVFGPIIDACLQYSYPLSVNADALQPDAESEGSIELGAPDDPISARATSARAHAGTDAVTTVAEIADLDVLGAPALGALPPFPGFDDLEPYVLAVGSIRATTSQRIDEAGALVTEAVAALSDVSFLGGLVEVGSIVSRSTIVDGEGDPAIETSFDVAGVRAAGMSARFGEHGIEIGEASQPLGPQLEALSRQLAALLESVSFRMETLPVEEGIDEDGIAYAGVGGMLVEMAVPVGGLPAVPGPLGDIDLNGDYVATFQLGRSGVRALASAFDDAAPLRPSPAGGGLTGGATGGGGPSLAGGGASGGGAPAPGPAPVTPEAPVEVDGSPISDLFADRLRLLYVAFTLAALGVCVAPSLTVPSRFPEVSR